jgi:excisionase family DNA binding protein
MEAYMGEFLTAEEVAKRLGYANVESVYRIVRKREIDTIVLGRRMLRFTPEAVEKFIREHTLPAKEL